MAVFKPGIGARFAANVTIDTGGLTVTAGGISVVSGAISATGALNASHSLQSDYNGSYSLITQNTNATGPSGFYNVFPNAAPNDTTHLFTHSADSSATRCDVRSNGGIANFSA
jgi:hypothetical protein